MNSTFGTRLRSHRERQQIALSTIAERTKIKLSLLDALERDDVTHWPTGIFGRSYLRSYAQAVGLDPDATVREFAECHPVEVHPPLSELREKTAERGSRWPPTRLQFLIDSAIDAFHTRRAEPGQRTGPEAVSGSEAAAFVARPEGSLAPERPEQPPVAEPGPGVDLLTLAQLCTRLGSAEEAHELVAVLEDAADLFDAVGVILWIPDSVGVTLTCAFAHGYPNEMIAQLPAVPADAHNAIAEAYRTHAACVVHGTVNDNGAVVAPLLTPAGCSGLLSLELRNGAEQREDVRAGLTILAAQVSTLMGSSVLARTRTRSA